MAEPGGYVTTHVLDTAAGQPASGMRIDVFRLAGPDGASRELLTSLTTNADGRTDVPAIEAGHVSEGRFELVFHAGAYLDQRHGTTDGARFLDLIPIRFGVTDAAQHYHVPLLLSPYGYSTYRGS